MSISAGTHCATTANASGVESAELSPKVSAVESGRNLRGDGAVDDLGQHPAPVRVGAHLLQVQFLDPGGQVRIGIVGEPNRGQAGDIRQDMRIPGQVHRVVQIALEGAQIGDRGAVGVGESVAWVADIAPDDTEFDRLDARGPAHPLQYRGLLVRRDTVFEAESQDVDYHSKPPNLNQLVQTNGPASIVNGMEFCTRGFSVSRGGR